MNLDWLNTIFIRLVLINIYTIAEYKTVSVLQWQYEWGNVMCLLNNMIMRELISIKITRTNVLLLNVAFTSSCLNYFAVKSLDKIQEMYRVFEK